jgi:hypothetical protein
LQHRFQTGERVVLIRGFPHRNAADGLYEVMCQLPYGNGDFQYRIKNEREQFQRVVKEIELDVA